MNLYAGSLFIKLALGWDLYVSVLLVLSMTAVCTITGGLAAAIYTESIQTILMLIGGLTLMSISFQKIGGYQSLYIKYMEAIPESIRNSSFHNITSPYAKCGIPKKEAFQMLRSVDDNYMPWLGFFLGQTPTSIWYWCSDQVIIFKIKKKFFFL